MHCPHCGDIWAIVSERFGSMYLGHWCEKVYGLVLWRRDDVIIESPEPPPTWLHGAEHD